MALSRILKKDGYCFKKRIVIFDIPFIVMCNWINWIKLSKNCCKH